MLHPILVTPRRLLHLSIAAFALAGSGGVAGSPRPAFAIVEAKTSFQSGGHRIKVETFLPSGEGRHAAVLVLYGSGGALFGKNEMEQFARQLAARGTAAFLVHYFNRTGTLVAGDKSIHALWPQWAEAVKDGVDFVSRHPRVRPEALGMMGYSLGAYLAVADSTRDRRIRAVVALAGGLFDSLHGRTERFPPMLILHGRADERVAVSHVAGLQKEARRFGVTPSVKIYDGEGHRLSDAASADAVARALTFLDEHLSR